MRMFQIWWRCLIDINNNYLQNQHAGATSIDIKLLPFVKDQLNVGTYQPNHQKMKIPLLSRLSQLKYSFS